ncbi:uncharacterized protein [Anabrus simplex]|uniref:uncharacterized protein n=1 Tax=Anabrus simplex TaxID=316456 RepID=UPI0035A3058E
MVGKFIVFVAFVLAVARGMTLRQAAVQDSPSIALGESVIEDFQNLIHEEQNLITNLHAIFDNSVLDKEISDIFGRVEKNATSQIGRLQDVMERMRQNVDHVTAEGVEDTSKEINIFHEIFAKIQNMTGNVLHQAYDNIRQQIGNASADVQGEMANIQQRVFSGIAHSQEMAMNLTESMQKGAELLRERFTEVIQNSAAMGQKISGDIQARIQEGIQDMQYNIMNGISMAEKMGQDIRSITQDFVTQQQKLAVDATKNAQQMIGDMTSAAQAKIHEGLQMGMDMAANATKIAQLVQDGIRNNINNIFHFFG